ncbi:MAG: hypothetical protein P4L76_08680 [Beijerinckiaceae bacterium]|nr:hypothetical protein [Beijerinckiaceae bacterium]
MKFTTAAFVSSLAVLSLVSLRLNAEEPPKRDTATLLFETPDWSKAPVGTTITYDYSRQTYGSTEYGEHFDDTASVSVTKGETAESRKVDIQLFTGPHRRPTGTFESTTTNPILLLIFENNIQYLAGLFHANPQHFKSAIRKAWREESVIEDVSVNVGGKTVPGTRVTIHPYVNDEHKDLMKGLDGMTYTVEIADSVPGEIATIDIHAPADGAPKFSETLRFKAAATP